MMLSFVLFCVFLSCSSAQYYRRHVHYGDYRTARLLAVECESDSHCGGRTVCDGGRCINPCEGVYCIENSYCEIYGGRGQCVCFQGYVGNPNTRCRPPYEYEGSVLTARTRSVGIRASSDPCHPSPCGSNTRCRVRGERPVCECLPGHKGDPRTHCQKGDCLLNEDCAFHKSCVNNYCVDPCLNKCGLNARCEARRHVAVCSCYEGYEGDPKYHCREVPRDPCLTLAGLCKRNSECRSLGKTAQCRCLPGYQGDPLTGCEPQCRYDSECGYQGACVGTQCEYPCQNACGKDALCEIKNSVAVCSCPEDFLGSPYTECYPECVKHTDCGPQHGCFSFKCKDPCVGACGTNALCDVEDHKAICKCPREYVGHPFTECRPFRKEEYCTPNPCGRNADCTPGVDRTGSDRPVCTCPVGYTGDPLVHCRRGECLTHSDCPSYRSCNQEYVCEDPCSHRPCGSGAICTPKNHKPVCECPPGTTGNALSHCITVRVSRRYN